MSFRLSPKSIGPFRINFSSTGNGAFGLISSVSLKAGPASVRIWSHNKRPNGVTSINTPGWGSWRTRLADARAPRPTR